MDADLCCGCLASELAQLREAAERLVGKAQDRLESGHNDTCGFMLGNQYPCSCGSDALEAALTRLRTVLDGEASVGAVHPDTARLDWLETQKSDLWPMWFLEWDRGEFMGLNFAMEGAESEAEKHVLEETIREAIDTARDAEEG